MTQQNKQVHIPYAVGTGVAMILIGVILKLTKLEENSIAQYISFAPFLVGIILNCIAYSKANDRYVTFGQTFASGFKATALVTLILITWTLASLYIWPNTEAEALAKASAEMEKGGKLSQAQIDEALAFTKKNFKTFLVAGTVFGALLFGVIFSLIGAAIAPKNGNAQRPEILDTHLNNNRL